LPRSHWSLAMTKLDKKSPDGEFAHPGFSNFALTR